ncbi:MAG: hypothetical protein ACO3B3_03610 [Cyanobium sp.]
MLKATYMRRATTLSKALLSAGLLGATALSALGAGSAQAATGCGVEISWAAWVGGQALTCEDKQFTWLSTTTLGDLNAPGTVVSAVQPNPGDYLFNLDKEFTNTAFDFTYEALITTTNSVFTSVDLDTNANDFANPPSVLTATYSFTGGNSPIILTSTNGTPDLAPVAGGPSAIIVNNNYDGNGAIDAVENSFQQKQTVPGPLPLLGAGAAFGFSRKLRRRLKGVSLARG